MAKAKLSKLTFLEWQIIGNCVKELGRHISILRCSFKASDKSMNRAFKNFQVMKSDLDNLVCREFPDESKAVEVFYGSQKQKGMEKNEKE